MPRAILLLSLLLAACTQIPRDPEGTLDHIRASGEIRVGVIGDPEDGAALIAARRLLARVEDRTGARAEIEQGSAARLLPLLEAGELDLVLGRFDRATPWSKRVALSTPIAELRLPPDPQDFAAAMRHGENAWIMLVENEARAIAGPER